MAERPLNAIVIDNAVLAKIRDDASQFAGRTERGGIFLGTRRGPHIQIAEATVPMRWDLGSMFSFFRSARGHRAVARKRWRESAGTIDWVGEWHSHPERVPRPSEVDLKTWRRITGERGAAMVFLIVGYDGLWVGMMVPGSSQPVEYRAAEQSSGSAAFLPL